MFYWLITLWDGEQIRVKPQNVDVVKGKLSKGEGHLITANRTIAIKDIKGFEESDITYQDDSKLLETSQGALEEASRAFNDPLIGESGGIRCRAVKKSVTRKKYDSYYSDHPGYRFLSEDDNRVVVGFFCPIHSIDYKNVQDCTPDEAKLVART